MTAPVPLRYRAFLSYAHADTSWGRWLHRSLESFRIDADLVGKPTPRGTVLKSLRPIFRDREDFTGGHTLTDATLEALAQSDALIVLCSTVSATRPAVNEEVRLFRWRHPERPVIPVIIDGTFPDNFPPALRCEIGPDGVVLIDRPVTLLGPDLRDAADGKALGLAKIVAGLTGLAPDDIFRRAERERRRQARVRWAVVGVIASLAAGGAWLYVDSQRKGTVIAEKVEQENAALAIARQMLGANPAAAASPGAQQGLIDALKAVQAQAAAGDSDYAQAFELLKSGRGADAVPLLLKAAEAKKARAAKENKDAAKAYREAAAIAAVAEPWRARELYAEAARLDPDDVVGLFQNGWFQQEAGQLAAADDAYRRVIAAGKSGGHDRAMYWARLGLGDLRVARGDLGAAKSDYRTAGQIAEAATKADPENAEWQRDLSVSYDKVGNVLVAQGQLPDALKAYRDSLAIAERLAKADPGNAGRQRDLSVSYNKVGDVLVAQGQLPDALKAYRDSLAIAERLAKADPGNAGWQRDVSVAYNKVGDVLVAQGQLPDALTAYRESLAIRERLAKADPGNAGWQRDLSVAYNKIGDVLRAQGNLPDALKAYREDLAIAERLAKTDPGNAGWKADLAASHGKLGQFHVALGDKPEALRLFKAGRAIVAPLAGTGHQLWIGYLRSFEADIAKLEK